MNTSSCQQCEESLGLYLYGELTPAEEELVEAHCAACETCRSALDRERAFQASLDRAEPEVPTLLLPSCRRDLSQAIAASGAGGLAQRSPFARVRDWFGLAGGGAAWKPALAALGLVACGFFAGRTGYAPAAAVTASSGLAQGNVTAPDGVLTRVRDVSSEGDGRVRLVLEETRQHTVGGSLDDDQIRGLLLMAAQDPADAGVRFGSVEALRGRTEAPDVRRVLMGVLERDPNPGVRLKAMESLRPLAAEPDVRALFARSLELDDNPRIRTQAVDSLIEHGQKDVVDVLQRLLQNEQNGYIRSRSRRALEAINASVETF